MSNENSQIITKAITLSFAITRAKDVDLRISDQSRRFLSIVSQKLLYSFSDLLTDETIDNSDFEKRLETLENRVEGLVIEKGLDQDDGVLEPARAIISSWLEVMAQRDANDISATTILMAGDSTTDAPPPENKKRK